MIRNIRKWTLFCSILALGLALGACSAAAQNAAPALSVDVAADRHPISPWIYGMAYPDPVLAAQIHLPLNRWGGDATTRYNWRINNTNSGADWFFMAGGRKPIPSGGPDKLITQARADGGRVLLTIPIIDYIDKAVDYDCSYPVSLFGPQQKVNPYVHPIVNGRKTDAGNGINARGQKIMLSPSQKLRINRPNSPEFQRGWIQHLVGKFGTSAHGGVGLYELDNEPGGWNNTHRDVHPGKTGDNELVSRGIAYAAAIKSVDPSALIVGPGDFMNHYQSDGTPTDGKKQHGGLGQGDYYLQQFHAYDVRHHQRLLDYFDEHFYPTSQEGQTPDTIIQATRSLWDPTYVEKNWIGKWKGPIDLIPKFRRWVDKYYPGTKVSLSEYGWGDNKTLIGMIADTDVLGIFGRERLDMACMFGPPKAGDPAANAFRFYLDYDGKGGKYGDTWVKSVSTDQSKLAIYGAQRSGDHVLTLIMINKTDGALTSRVSLSGFHPASSVQVFQYSNADLHAIVAKPDQPVTAAGFTATFPGKSVTMVAIPSR